MAQPIILATWTFGLKATRAGWPYLVRQGAGSLDAVEQACRAVEADPEVMTVGYGGYPDVSGQVSVDACIMRSPRECGAVCYVRRFMHPVSIARLIMEKTPHVMLAGEGAEQFAAQQGMAPADLLTDAAHRAWEDWRREHPESDGWMCAAGVPPANIEDQRAPRSDPPTTGGQATRATRNLPANEHHDTVGVLALDAGGGLAGACSTSGLPFKRPGRVGDSPIIGHGLYVDPASGAAVATGTGELIMGVCGSFLAVELMRRGASPAAAATEVIGRVAASYEPREDHQVGLITLAPSGEWSSAALRPGFKVAVRTPDRDELVDCGQVLLA
jgi:L-asparaginase/N4-(beta-N-acetylglucosaminyl)-L-asparaginase